jgi:hypothetical protein
VRFHLLLVQLVQVRRKAGLMQQLLELVLVQPEA